MKRHLAIYVEEHEFVRLKEEASRRRISLSRYVHDRIVQNLEAMEFENQSPGRTIPAMANDNTGTRAALAEELKPLSRQMGILTAMVDQFVLTMLINMPEIPESRNEQAIAAGERRHRGWQRAVEQLLTDIHAEAVGNHSPNSNGADA